MQNSSQPRGIHSGLVLFSQGNNGYYPGIDKDGNRMEDYSVEFRFQELLDDNYFTGEYLISPSETKTARESGTLTTANFSYAMLNLSNRNASRFNEWKDTSNDEAVVLSDRGVAHGTDYIRSVHTKRQTGTHDWRGSVAFNDNHVTFEATHNNLTTVYGEGETQQTFENDNLFDTTGASMVYSGNDTIIDKSK